MISHSVSRCGGLSQCWPMNLAGFFTAFAISVMERPLVFVASNASSGVSSLTSFQKLCLTFIFSTMHSSTRKQSLKPVSYTHLRAHETDSYLVCRLLLEK